MRLIINTTTLSGTGVSQVAISFINECIAFPENEYYVFLSSTVSKEINEKAFPNNFHFYSFDFHPLYGINGFKTRKRLKDLEKQINPDLVFTVFGPACWTPNSKHITGFANSYYVFPDSPFFKVIGFKDKLRIFLLKLGHRFFLKKNGEYFICKTDAMSAGLSRYLNISSNKVFTVSNTFSKIYENFKQSDFNRKILLNKEVTEFRFLILASYDVHKNLTILNEVIPLLKEKLSDINVKFILTINENIFAEKFTLIAQDYIINLGRVPIDSCPQLYSECDAVFLPTLIESFSANYPEAMIMEKPIMTSDLPFAKSICEDAALYFDPMNPEDIVIKIMEFVRNENLRDGFVKAGLNRLQHFGDASTRAKRYLEIFKELL
ncbi:glycosyltransferase [Sphingobacterium daejeonense]|uniref:glycosyltransferase n=1 Tax=Sphingobacterium daejeonense TaxID=371142 RepID=UPI003D313B12